MNLFLFIFHLIIRRVIFKKKLVYPFLLFVVLRKKIKENIIYFSEQNKCYLYCVDYHFYILQLKDLTWKRITDQDEELEMLPWHTEDFISVSTETLLTHNNHEVREFVKSFRKKIKI